MSNPTEHKADELLPCPFCGSSPRKFKNERGKVHIYCSVNEDYETCPIHPELSEYYEDEREAIKAWNTRAPDPRISELEAENKRLREALQFYAQGRYYRTLWEPPHAKVAIELDQGQRARNALEGK